MSEEFQTEASIVVGSPVVVESRSPTQPYGVVFEDDGESGYFYALEFQRDDNPIADALHIYLVSAVLCRDKPSIVQVVWSSDGMKALLRINGFPHAMFDFPEKRGYCRTGFPPPSGAWSPQGHEWDEAVLAFFR